MVRVVEAGETWQLCSIEDKPVVDWGSEKMNKEEDLEIEDKDKAEIRDKEHNTDKDKEEVKAKAEAEGLEAPARSRRDIRTTEL